MRVLLVLLAIVMVMPFQADARRRQRVIVVYDYTSAAWDGVVAQTVEDFNAVLPRRVRLHHERVGGPCFDGFNERHTYVVCSIPLPNGGFPGVYHPATHRIDLLDLSTVGASWGAKTHLACHELMHALTGIGDNYGALPDQSCVWGELSQPGPFDVDLLRETYRRKHR